ncbi:NUMOD4 domain-containing protein [Halobacillus litoralis]|uniref:NUMOD4 domain-containing protein n=1 Tax=Halobacillus litoralis TaxID=45668 RepID=A0A410MJB3_9BACI|nr:NUMOD4 domain-containing protein [Halobacillus litoralis]QAS54768.1 hypothetical protein HLI_21155 [Halobacillus litoralis]
MKEKHIQIEGYEGLYEITNSGRVYSNRSGKYLTRCNDEYGFHVVKLTNNSGDKHNYKVFDLWKKAFPSEQPIEFKGALNVKYGKGCSIL